MMLQRKQILFALVALCAVVSAGPQLTARELTTRGIAAPTPVFAMVERRGEDDVPGTGKQKPTPAKGNPHAMVERRGEDDVPGTGKEKPTPAKENPHAMVERRGEDDVPGTGKERPTPAKGNPHAMVERRGEDDVPGTGKERPTPAKGNPHAMVERRGEDDVPGTGKEKPTPAKGNPHALVERRQADEVAGTGKDKPTPAKGNPHVNIRRANDDDKAHLFGKRHTPSPTPVYNGDLIKRTSDEDRLARALSVLQKRQVKPTKPLSQMGPPNFPPNIPSCYNCQQKYSSLSSCMAASAVFENATSIFNNPMQYIDVLKCSCTDTFQAVYPQCLQCFQQTNQCEYLGTDPAGTHAPDLVTNMRNICGFASSILGGTEKANYPDSNTTVTPTSPPPYGDGTQTDQTTGPIFGSAASAVAVERVLPVVATVSFIVVATLLSM